MEFQSPFVNRCWHGPIIPDSETFTVAKAQQFVAHGCADKTGEMLKPLDAAFLSNGPLEILSPALRLDNLFKTRPGYTEIMCEVYMCREDQVCISECPYRKYDHFKMAKDALQVNVTALLFVEKGVVTSKPAAKDEKEVDNGIIFGKGDKKEDNTSNSDGQKSFLEKNQPYFLLACLGMVTLILMCIAAVGYKYISSLNNAKTTKKKQRARDHQEGCQDDVTKHVITPPPCYERAHVWTTPDSRKSNAYFVDEEDRRLIPSLSEVHSPRRQIEYHHDAIRSPRRDELYPEMRELRRSPPRHHDDSGRRLVEQGTNEILGAALSEYFEHRGVHVRK
ncbi:uncharacterized protein LOC128204336 [Mya arenaria]|nr:uncharacterized protein LOC128204336 [Mya arenaria]